MKIRGTLSKMSSKNASDGTLDYDRFLRTKGERIRKILEWEYEEKKDMIKYKNNVKALLLKGRTMNYFEMNHLLRTYESKLSENCRAVLDGFGLYGFNFAVYAKENNMQ